MSKRVLIVDDALFMRTMLRDIFTTAGWQVIAEAETGEQAITAYHEQQPDLVTMDLVMPEMGGIEALQAILRDAPDAAIVVCSALGQKSLILDAINSGAKDFIVKPFQSAQVLEVVERVISES
ncbi:two-component system, chemotaxis family, response regulator CheY [Desulfuromusa kysingii]|uniref:Two-component system, chemotaxis family, response regulator CheY n=1 Tax=Desulfuromusa kysingii TaxID=37625 RepID=A0A1H4AQW3_9BACT|nr:response regulator [Desulfuromusa kysingii]SEA38168.1 two-component system, chemotaxis family, response regulator CheY [Desulfuromusa kysingii]